MEQLQKYCLKECYIDDVYTYIIDQAKVRDTKDEKLLADLHISKTHMEALLTELEEANHKSLYLAFAYNPNFAEKYRWLPLLCYKNENTFYHVSYRSTWMCRECNYKYNAPIIMPMAEADTIIYHGAEYPKIPKIFKKENCPQCGKPLQNHLIILKNKAESE